MADGYRELTDREIDDIHARVIARYFQPRALAVVLVYALALTLTGIGAIKIAAFCLSIWFLIVLPLGRTFLEKVGGIWFFVALVAWLDIPLINRTLESVGAKLAAFF